MFDDSENQYKGLPQSKAFVERCTDIMREIKTLNFEQARREFENVEKEYVFNNSNKNLFFALEFQRRIKEHLLIAAAIKKVSFKTLKRALPINLSTLS